MKVNFGERRGVVVKDISFPKSEIDSLKKQTTIITHRVSSDADKFQKGDYVYAETIDSNHCFEIVGVREISRVEDSPYYKQLTKKQVEILKKYPKILVLTLKKSKYERPYKLSYIKEHYPEKVYEKLKNDKVHSWRAQTGIELIHKEPDNAEQTRVHNNWKLMSESMKSESDKKCKQWFGMTNEEHYAYIMKEGKNHEG